MEAVVAEGPEAGLTLPQLIERHGADLLGKRVAEQFGGVFPLLIKFIDARADLAVRCTPTTRPQCVCTVPARWARRKCGM